MASALKKVKVLPSIGWREWVGLPDLGVEKIKAKVDTGARSSSLHVYDLEIIQIEERSVAKFKVHPAQRTSRLVVATEADILEFRSIKSSSGKSSIRPVIVTRVQLLGQEWLVEMTLANRDQMGFRMLLGREAFRKRFLVDAGKSFLGGRVKRKELLKSLKKKKEHE